MREKLKSSAEIWFFPVQEALNYPKDSLAYKTNSDRVTHKNKGVDNKRRDELSPVESLVTFFNIVIRIFVPETVQVFVISIIFWNEKKR